MATPTINFYYWDGDSWEDISEHVRVDSVSGHWGMTSDSYADRLASTGEMSMTLDNTTGRFDPGDDDVLTGWGINTKLKWVVTFDGVAWQRFYGTVENISMSDPSIYDHTANVTVTDIMRYYYKFPLTQQVVETFKRGGYIVDKIVDEVGIAPLATNYAVGDYEFPAAFDGVTTTTKAATEMNKVALSEGGYIYSRHDKVNGETLVFEAESTRGGYFEVSKIPKMKADCGYLLKAGSATDKILLAGSTDKIILNEVENAHMDGVAGAYARVHGENIINKVRVTVYPKRIDESEQTLYKLGASFTLGSGKTTTIKAKYKNYDTKEDCNALTALMVDPVATTDYLMRRKGKTTDLTSLLTVVAEYGTAEVTLTLTNTSKYTGVIYKFICRGFGIYQDASITIEVEDTASQTAYGANELTIQQQYQRDVEMAEMFANKIVDREAAPHTRLKSIAFIANKSNMQTQAFLAVDIGDIVKITESDLNLANYYYVQGINFNVTGGNVIAYEWILAEALPSIANGGLTSLIIEASGAPIDFGRVKEIDSLDEVTISMTVDDLLPTRPITQKALIGFGTRNTVSPDYNGCWIFGLYGNGTYSYPAIRNYKFDSGVGAWRSTDYAFELAGNPVRLAVTYNVKDVDADPLFYSGGVSLGATIESATPTGGLVTDQTSPLTINGIMQEDGTYESYEHKINNVKIWNRILTADELADDAAGDDILDGLIFWGIHCPTDATADYYEQSLTAANKLYETLHGYIGTPVLPAGATLTGHEDD